MVLNNEAWMQPFQPNVENSFHRDCPEIARRLVELFLAIGFRFGFHSFGIRLGWAAPPLLSSCGGVEQPGGGGAASISSDAGQDISLNCDSKLKLESKNQICVS